MMNIPKTLEIIGNGPTRELATYAPDRAVWMMNNHAFYAGRVPSALFEMHPNPLQREVYKQDYLNWLRQEHPFPIYAHEKYPEIPSSQRYPLELVNAWLPSNITVGNTRIRNAFGSTVSYMLALAYVYGYQDIYLYGIDLDKGHEVYRENTIYWLGKVRPSQTVHLPPGSDLVKEELYYNAYPK